MRVVLRRVRPENNMQWPFRHPLATHAAGTILGRRRNARRSTPSRVAVARVKPAPDQGPAGSRQQAAGSRQQAAGSRQQGAGSGHSGQAGSDGQGQSGHRRRRLRRSGLWPGRTTFRTGLRGVGIRVRRRRRHQRPEGARPPVGPEGAQWDRKACARQCEKRAMAGNGPTPRWSRLVPARQRESLRGVNLGGSLVTANQPPAGTSRTGPPSPRRFGRVRAQHTHADQHNDDDAERDAVPDERHEALGGDELHTQVYDDFAPPDLTCGFPPLSRSNVRAVGDGTFQCSPSLATKRSHLVCSEPAVSGLQRTCNLLLHGQGNVRVETIHAGDLAAHALLHGDATVSIFVQPLLAAVTKQVQPLSGVRGCGELAPDPRPNCPTRPWPQCVPRSLNSPDEIFGKGRMHETDWDDEDDNVPRMS